MYDLLPSFVTLNKLPGLFQRKIHPLYNDDNTTSKQVVGSQSGGECASALPTDVRTHKALIFRFYFKHIN